MDIVQHGHAQAPVRSTCIFYTP